MPKDLNPTTMGGAHRLMSDPDALDRAIATGLGASGPDPTFDRTAGKARMIQKMSDTGRMRQSAVRRKGRQLGE